MNQSLETNELDAQTESRPGGVAKARASPRQSAAELAQWVAQAGLDKKATDIRIVDVRGRVDYADYLVVLTGASDRHVAAIARGIEAELARAGVKCLPLEGLPQASWVLIDFVDVVVHVFQADSRGSYDLDGLWMDAPQVPLQSTAGAAQPRAR